MPNKRGTLLLRLAVGLGVFSLLFYLSWWYVPGRIMSRWLATALAFAAFYSWMQLISGWFLYIRAKRRPVPPPPSVWPAIDVFVPAYKEPFELTERCLKAAVGMRGPHRTWLLDDNPDPALDALAARLGAGHLTRRDRLHAKAGNVNAALALTEGEIIVIFDADHAPEPDFLERSIGHFADPAVGFVQVMLSFSNAAESWIARAASESTIDFFNVTSLGADAVGSATLLGSNALIRRKALESISGYRPGLAEDLATSIALHAAGWKSVYVAEPLAPGMAPPDLHAWFTQQLKWARGVFEILLISFPRALPRLTWGQRISYSVRTTYYFVGLVMAVHLFFMIAILNFGSGVARVDFHQYVLHILPLAVVSLLIRQTAILLWRHPSSPATILWRPMLLVGGTWPVYVFALFMAAVRAPLAFRLTPKKKSGKMNPLWLLPQAAAALLLLSGIAYSVLFAVEPRSYILLSFAVLQCLPMVTIIAAA